MSSSKAEVLKLFLFFFEVQDQILFLHLGPQHIRVSSYQVSKAKGLWTTESPNDKKKKKKKKEKGSLAFCPGLGHAEVT